MIYSGSNFINNRVCLYLSIGVLSYKLLMSRNSNLASFFYMVLLKSDFDFVVSSVLVLTLPVKMMRFTLVTSLVR